MKITTQHIERIASKTTLALLDTALSLAASVLLASCAIAPPTIVRETVGPQVAAANEEHDGYLTVYSSSIWTAVDDLGYSLVYTNYDIHALDGSVFQRVENGGEEPTRVLLPKGRYTVVAESDTAGTISVPVAIETGRITVLHLDGKRDSEKAFAGIDGADLVRLPDGQAIGLRTRHTESSEASRMMLASSNHRAVPLAQPKS